MSVSFPSSMPSKVQTLLTTIANYLQASISLISPQFRLTLESTTGKDLNLVVTSLDQGRAYDPSKGIGKNQTLGVSADAMPAMFPALAASAGVQGTLVAGTVDIALPNAAGDVLAVHLVTAGGTPGVLSVKSKDADTVTVESWLAATGIEALDTSVVAAYNFGQAS